MSRFSQLIDEVADQKNHSLSDVLLKAKVLSRQLPGRKFRQWIDSEINGYSSKKNVPEYRVVSARLYGDFAGLLSSRVTNVPISTSHLDEDIRKTLENEPIANGVSYIEDMLNPTDGQIGKSLGGEVVNFLRKYGMKIDGMILNFVRKSIARPSLVELLSGVRSRLLDFLLEVRERYPELDKNDEAANGVSAIEIDAAVDRKVYQNCTVFEGAEMRDIYQAGQAGAMGPGAKAEKINFVQILRDAIGDNSLADLANDLERLRTAMLSESKNADQDEAVAAVAEAEAAAKKGDAKSVFAFLKRAGNWAMDVATKIGTAVAGKAIEKSMGL
jgi:hypothetical protein